MEIIKNIYTWQKTRAALTTDKTLGVVMTMGALHAGHLHLIQQSQQDNDYTLITLFVNPTQFNNQDDLKTYPNTLAKDMLLLKKMDVDFVLAPTAKAMYPDDYCYQISEKSLSKILCGQSRPGHFAGVLTVVMKFLQLAQADRAYFGEKDYQQYKLIENMVNAFFIPTEIISCATVRDDKGLAYSSRNFLLNQCGLQQAYQFAQIIRRHKNIDMVKAQLHAHRIEIDYLQEHFGRRFVAVIINGVRLIDNISLDAIDDEGKAIKKESKIINARLKKNI